MLLKQTANGFTPRKHKEVDFSSSDSQSNGKRVVAVTSNIDELLATTSEFLPRTIKFHKSSKPSASPLSMKANYTPINVGSKSGNGTSTVFVHTGQKSADGKTPSATASAVLKDDNLFVDPTHSLFPADRMAALLKWKEVKKVGAGLYNLGNTCFLNSVLQALLYTPPLVNYLNTREHSSACRPNTFCLFCEMEKCAALVHNAATSAIQPKGIVGNLRAISKSFRLGRQEDSHEFIRFVMDALQNSVLRGLPKLNDEKIKHTSVVHRIFGGYLRSQVRCLQCSYESNTYDAFLDLSLECGGLKQNTLQHTFAHFTAPEKLDHDNKYMCKRCGKKVPARKQLTIFRSPTVLTIQLKRFAFGHSFGGKINKHILFEPTLDLQPYLSSAHINKNDPKSVAAAPQSPEGSQKYSLYAVLVHHGHSLHSGHYVCYVKSSTGTWHLMDDSSVRTVPLNNVLSQSAYMLFYVKDRVDVSAKLTKQLKETQLQLQQKQKAAAEEAKVKSKPSPATTEDMGQSVKRTLSDPSHWASPPVKPVPFAHQLPALSKFTRPLVFSTPSFASNGFSSSPSPSPLSSSLLHPATAQTPSTSPAGSLKRSRSAMTGSSPSVSAATPTSVSTATPNGKPSLVSNAYNSDSDTEEDGAVPAPRANGVSSKELKTNHESTADPQPNGVASAAGPKPAAPKAKRPPTAFPSASKSGDAESERTSIRLPFNPRKFAWETKTPMGDAVGQWDEDPKREAERLALLRAAQPKKKRKDAWDEELDKGKVKKIKKKKVFVGTSEANPFQDEFSRNIRRKKNTGDSAAVVESAPDDL